MHVTKVSATLLLVLMVGALAFSLNSRAFATSTVLYVYPQPSYAASSVGQNVSIQVNINLVAGLTAYQFGLSFSPTLLTCLGWQVGSFFPPPPNSTYTVTVDNTHGTISANVQLQTGQSASGNGVLLKLTFNATYGTPYGTPTKASCVLGLTGDVLHAGGSTISHTTLNSTYISPYATPVVTLSLNTSSAGDAPNSGYFDHEIDINGNVSGNGYPVNDALVALELRSNNREIMVARTLSTSTPPSQIPLSIVGLTPAAQGGTPQNVFSVDSLAFFVVQVTNNAQTSYNGVVMVNVYDSSNASLGVGIIPGTFASGQTNILIPEVFIGLSAYSGQATAYASVFSDFAENGGVPLCLEVEAQFTITGSAQGTPLSMNQPARGAYGTALIIPYSANNNSTGNWAVYVQVSYMGNNVSQTKQFWMGIAGDINKDGIVGLNDLVLLALAYGSRSGNSKWNPACDIDGNGVIGLGDLVMLALDYGHSTNP